MTRVFLFLLLLVNINAFSQATSYKSEFGFRSDNDAYLAFGQDKYYTNGLFLTFRTAPDQTKLKEPLAKVIWEMEAGQKMYTPSTADVNFRSEVDRPFAGYTYAGINLNLMYKNEHSFKIGLQAGVIGPQAKAKEAQEVLHNTFGFYEVSGWEWQVANEFGINTEFNYNALIYRDALNRTDFIFQGYANLGTTFTSAGAGLMFRSGSINPLFNTASTHSRISNQSDMEESKEKEFFFYARPMLNFIAFDATIEGPLFSENKGPITYGIKPLVISQQLGLTYASPKWSLDFNIVIKSREVKSRAGAHQYGSVSVFRRF